MKIKSICLLGAAWLSLADAYCPPTGSVLPPPDISSDGKLTETLNNALRKLAKSGIWNTTTTSFSIELTSSKENIFSFHHTSPKLNSSGVDKVDGKTIYRVASVTKVFTTLALLLQNGINLDDSITKYVPELSKIAWYKDVTLRMLASQISGVHRDGYTFDLATTFPPKVLHRLGFPDVERPPEVPLCDTLSDLPCTRAEFFKDLENNEYVWQPGQRAAYSDLGFILLGFALENMTGLSYGDIILQQISNPLNLSSVVGFKLEDVSKSILPTEGGSQWIERDFGNYAATAGLYATPDDLSRFVRGVLSHKLLTGPRTNSWLQPATFTSSFYSSVGMPWEIYRSTSLTPSVRPVDVYTKSGDVGVYAAYIALIPEYDAGFTINAAGADAYITSRALLNEMTKIVVQGLDQLARSQAQSRYTGHYSGNNDSLVLAIDKGPGLKIQKWTSNGDSVLGAWQQLRAGGGQVEARIYPIGKDDRWRVVFEAVSNTSTSPFGNACYSWFQVDQFRYQGLPVDEIDFVIEDGQVKGLSVPGLRQTLAKTSSLSY
ncbi:hypothetical protein CDV31_009608 [Fusarium ambrosium]|uniref:Uncharacterized protein n=1 Tax=Fusarium ambrosium TaxID=131363 RepID=A0A428TTH1_9HYPO|nr:hypothetical protein CDV31_009608 [Fusarium ambrosium]